MILSLPCKEPARALLASSLRWNLHKGKASQVEKGVLRISRKRIASAREISCIAGYCIALEKVVVPSKLFISSLYYLLRRTIHCEECLVLANVDCIRDFQLFYSYIVGIITS